MSSVSSSKSAIAVDSDAGVQCVVLYTFPVWVAKEIMLASIIGNILRGILKECVKRFPGGNTSGPEYLQIEGRAEILLVAAS